MLINIIVVEAESSDRLRERLNARRIEIMNRGNEIKIQYAPPAIDPINSSLVWSALVEEYLGHSLG